MAAPGDTLVAVAGAAERKVVEKARFVEQLPGERHPVLLLPLRGGGWKHMGHFTVAWQ